MFICMFQSNYHSSSQVTLLLFIVVKKFENMQFGVFCMNFIMKSSFLQTLLVIEADHSER